MSSTKTGLSAIAILPQNLLATKEENPKKFYAQILYLIIYVCLAGLFIAYAVTQLLELIDAQDNPVITTKIKSQDLKKGVEFPVVTICSFSTLDSKSIFTGEVAKCGTEYDIFSGDACKGKKRNKIKTAEECKNNINLVAFPSFDVRTGKPNYDEYFGCLIVNSDEPITDKIYSEITETDCKIKNKNKKDKKKKKFARAIAQGNGYYDVLAIHVDSDQASLSVTVTPKVTDLRAQTPDEANLIIPTGTTFGIYLEKSTFQCAECDEPITYYNFTSNIISIDNLSDDKKVRTTILVYFADMNLREQEEIYTMGALDYLGNFAGMLGTLLAFAVITTIDRILVLTIVRHGSAVSVWDD